MIGVQESAKTIVQMLCKPASVCKDSAIRKSCHILCKTPPAGKCGAKAKRLADRLGEGFVSGESRQGGYQRDIGFFWDSPRKSSLRNRLIFSCAA